MPDITRQPHDLFNGFDLITWPKLLSGVNSQQFTHFCFSILRARVHKFSSKFSSEFAQISFKIMPKGKGWGKLRRTHNLRPFRPDSEEIENLTEDIKMEFLTKMVGLTLRDAQLRLKPLFIGSRIYKAINDCLKDHTCWLCFLIKKECAIYPRIMEQPLCESCKYF